MTREHAPGPAADAGGPADRDARTASVRASTAFPWWYLGGAGLTLVVLVLVVPAGLVAAPSWGPVIGLEVQQRRAAEHARRDRDADRPRPPARLEPAVAAVWTGTVIGLGFVVGALVWSAPAAIGWTGLTLLVLSSAALTVLRSWARAHRTIETPDCRGDVPDRPSSERDAGRA